MARKSSRDAILDAAARVVRRQGLANATVEAVAQEAGISKGGLFYHFPSKKEMFLRLLDRSQEHFLALRAEIMETLPPGPSRLLKATIAALLEHPGKEYENPSNIVALLDDVDLRNRISDLKARLFKEVGSTSRHPEKVALAMLAVDGLRMSELFKGVGFHGAFRKKIVAELMRIIDILDKEGSV